MNKFKEEIAWLERVSKGDYFSVRQRLGLCFNFSRLFPFPFNPGLIVLIDFSEYPGFSGDISFPLKSTNKKRTPKGDYFFHRELGNMYKGRTGAMRRHFAGWCAGELRKLGEAK